MNNFSEAKLQDVYTPLAEFHWVSADANLSEAIILLTKSKINKNTGQIILVRDNNLPVGFINIECFLGLIEPNNIEGVSVRGRNVKTSTWSIPVFWEGQFSECCIKLKNLTAQDVMIPFKNTIDVHEHLIKVVHNLKEHNEDIMPVTENSQIIGFVGYSGIFKEIVRLAKNDDTEVIDISKAVAPEKQPVKKFNTSKK